MPQPPLRLIPAAQLGDLPPTQRLGTTKLVAHGLNVVFGPSGSYKSFYILDAALRLAQSRPVVYVAGEGVGGLNKRVIAWCEHNQCGAGESYFIGRAVNLLDSTEAQELVKLLAVLQPVALIFDTLARCIVGADENSAKDVGRAVATSNYIQQALTCAVIWIHHTNRAQRGERGSGAIRGAADNMIEIFPNGDGSIQITCSKDKDGQPWVSEQLSFLAVGDSGVLVSTRGYAAMQYSEMEIKILEFLALDTFETGARVMQMVNSLNIPERTIYRLLSHLKRECQITQGKKGDPFFLTDTGRSTLGVVSATDPEVTEIVVE